MKEDKFLNQISQQETQVPVLFADENKGIFSITGESFPEDCSNFYMPFLERIFNCIQNNERQILIEIKLSYYNTGTSKILMNFLKKIYNYCSEGKQITVKWYCDKNDLEIIQDVEDFELVTGLEIEIITF